MNESFKSITISEQNTGKRLDNLLFNQIKTVPKSLIYKLIRKGKVRINGKKSLPSKRLELGDIVEIPPNLQSNKSTRPPPERMINLINESVIHENENFMVINKPAGLGSHSGTGLDFGLIEIARQARRETPKLDLVHRLDRDTSGCIILSKNLPTLRLLHKTWLDAKVEKLYIGLFKGQIELKRTRIDVRLGIEKFSSEEKRAYVGAGKVASTSFVKKEYRGGNTLATLKLDTGRMHQIRAHAQYIGHPLAGDNKYGDFKFNAKMKKLGLSRLFLHASSVRIHSNEINLDVKAPFPAELLELLDQT